MAAAKKRTAKKTGRPVKGDAPVEQVRSVRFTSDDCALVDAIISDEKKRAAATGGLMARLTFADVLRALVRQEAERRGISSAA
jgi:hypothetical protein